MHLENYWPIILPAYQIPRPLTTLRSYLPKANIPFLSLLTFSSSTPSPFLTFSSPSTSPLSCISSP